MARLWLTTDFEALPEVCFDLVLNVDVQLAIDDGMRAVGGVQTGRLVLGDIVTWRARHFGVVWRMTSKIVEFDPPRGFVDRMETGPFASWRHIHRFEPIAGGTRMIDDVAYETPLGIVGGIFDILVLERYMKRLLRRRNCRLKSLAVRQI